MKSVWVSIINFKGKDDTLECLKSLEKTKKDFVLNVVVIDNGSQEKLKLPNYSYNLEVIESKKNLGFSDGHNLGIKYALDKGADYVVILNNDTVVDSNLISELLKTANSNPEIGITAPKIYFYKGFEFYKDRYRKEELGRVLWLAGGVM